MIGLPFNAGADTNASTKMSEWSELKNSNVEISDLEKQAQRSFQFIHRNLRENGIVRGAVIASPSKHSPNYFYHWVRDAGLTMRELIAVYANTKDLRTKGLVKELILDWVIFEESNQRVATFNSNLGEPIFTVLGEIYPHPWGRPQTDGPAIRALAMIEWLEALVAEGGNESIIERLYQPELPANSPIKKDLEYIAHNWQLPSFDLWEEVRGNHFFTRMAQRAALIKGSALAFALGDNEASKFYKLQSQLIETELLKHIDGEREFIRPTLSQTDGWTHKTSELDVSVILGSLYFSLEDNFFTPDSKYVLMTAQKLENQFKNIYSINKTLFLGTAIGRYPEDVYDGTGFGGGNPWFLATNAFAELHCRAARFVGRGSVNERDRAHSFLRRALYHSDRNGHMSEQISRHNGYMMGARDLTWSYSSFVRALRYCEGPQILGLFK